VLHGLDEPEAATDSPIVGQTLSEEEIDIQLARLTPDERHTFMMLVQKMGGR
jgi:hypothetical protein